MKNTPSPRRIRGAHAFLLGALVALLALAPAIIPFGGRFVTRGDYIEQQLPFIMETRRLIAAGPNAYSFNTFLGAPGVGSYAFYTLGSVFVWPLMLVSDALVPFGVSVMAVLKHAVCAMISFLYFRRMLKEDRLALLGSVLYTFSSFTVINTQFYHFTEVIAFFPLILLGLEDAMGEKPRPGLLALACGLNALTNYYFMLSSALLAALYFAFRFFSREWRPQRSAKRVLAVLFECAAGCALSGVLLLPAMHYMLSISRGGLDLTQLTTPYTLQTLLERLRSLLMPVESGVVHAFFGGAPSWTSTAAYLPVFGLCGAAVFFSTKRGGWLKGLLLSLAVCSVVPALCGAFALFTNVSYTRWWYGLALMLTLATLYALRDAPLTLRRWKLSLAACTAAALLLALPSLLPQALLERLGAGTLLSFREGAYAAPVFRRAALALFALGTAALLLILTVFKHRPRAAMALVCLVAAVNYASYIAVGDRHLLSGGSEASNGVYPLEDIAGPMLSSLEQTSGSEEFVRIDYGRQLRNYGLMRGQSSLTCFSSLRPGLVNRFAEMAGFGLSQSPTVSPPDAGGAMRALLSVKEYHLFPGETVPEGFTCSREENGFSVYTNDHYVPMGFLQTTFTGTHDQPMNPQDIAPVMLAAATLEPDAIAKLEGRMQRLDVHAIPAWQESAARLQENACSSFETRADGFTAHIDAKEAGLLIFTIPYDKGFRAEIDGEPAEIILCDVAFMGVWVEPGAHEIVFTYRTRSLMPGAAMSAAAALALAVCVLVRRRKSA